MSVSEWVPVVSVVASAAVGLGVPLITARNDQKRILTQAEQVRLDELRGVIDDAGAAVTGAIFALDQAIQEASEPTPVVEALSEGTDPAPARDRSALDAYIKRLEGLWTHENRLAVRLGSGDLIYFQYGEAVGALQKPLWVLDHVAAGEPFDGQRGREVQLHRRDASQGLMRFHEAAATRLAIKPPDERRRLLTRGDQQ